MKKVSEKDLNRMKKKGGVKVKRRLGTKKPEPEAEAEEALSGAVEAKAPVPASPRTVPEGFIETTNDKDHTHLVRLPEVPHAAMAASQAAANADVGKLIAHNAAAIENLSKKLHGIKPRKRVPWRHKIIRTKDRLIDEIISTPMEKKA